MKIPIRRHLSVACRAALIAFNRSSRNGESLDEILGYIDALTGIPNRKSFEEDRSDIKIFETFILVDVDNLKQLNDTFGHLFGDEILKSCAAILTKATERIGKAYRLAGDEFAVIIPECWVKTVSLYINNQIKQDGRFTISMGIAPSCGADGLTDELFRAAETMLYQRKIRNPDIYSEFLTDIETSFDSPDEFSPAVPSQKKSRLELIEA